MVALERSNKQNEGRVQLKQVTKICWQLIAPPSTPDFSGEVGALGLDPII